jgi:hypothetical protein
MALLVMGWLVARQPPGTQVFGQAAPVRRPSQGQVAGRFLRAILRADYTSAYGQLAPEVRRALPLGQFQAAAVPLWKSGQRRHSTIELYKLGVRLGDGGASRLFYSFSFAADSALQKPRVLLEVTFRDTASRAVLGFGLQTPAQPTKAGKPSAKPRKQ